MRLFLVFFIIIKFIVADDFDVFVRDFIGEKQYNTQKQLIDVVFFDKEKYRDQDGQVNVLDVFSTLKQNGLIQLFFNSPQNQKIHFISDTNALMSILVVNEALKSMGYGYFLTEKTKRDSSGIYWTISLLTQNIIDPNLLDHKLKEYGANIVSIKKDLDSQTWHYKINTRHASMKAIELFPDSTITLKKPILPYLIKTSGVQKVVIAANIADRWYPQIVFFNSKFEQISEIRLSEQKKMLRLDLQQGVYYIKINDKYTLENIKHGLTIKSY